MAVITLLLFLLPFHLHLFKGADSSCPKSFDCGKYNLTFPFTKADDPGCGLFTVDGCDTPYPVTNLGGGGLGFAILDYNSSEPNKMFIGDYQLGVQLRNRSCFAFMNQSMLRSPSVSFSFSPNLTLFPCLTDPTDRSRFDDDFVNYSMIDCLTPVYYKIPATNDSPPEGCSLVQLPLNSSGKSDDLFSMITSNFTLEWNVSDECLSCFDAGGLCLTENNNRFYCKRSGNQLKKILLATLIPGFALLACIIFTFLFTRMKRAKEKQEHDRDIELFLKNNGNLAPLRYKHSTIKKMTNSFSKNLGRGGFGSVYKGQFPDGRLMAVKVLNESNGNNGEDFMNEVASISRTSHVNIVALLGFCFEGSKRALIYDFMPNGSLEKFIGNNVSSSQESGLGWEKLFEIALGIARGLEYLHQGCNTRILHLDIKPQNILLDKDMNPRISDFGLAKLCPNRSSIVSMTVARGTIGYIAPEVFSRNFGEVSYKSDVYSYGMLILEMAGGKGSIDPRDADCSSEIYFPHYLYKQLEMNAKRDGDLCGAINEEDKSQHVKRNLIIVGLWCIQTNPKDRPSMTRVVEMLEGKTGTLEVPPKPYLNSPPRSPQSFTTFESV
ncbi:LEAF RUST 10 DISEASE-RESISTANCE LOCUS RECEPTOR-LIKE PROTEIN KINASE-like 2.5 isoform X2 [Salvia hispanica]|uniref:LEAF RUST 10 DISEASE-RESISTANCE LOCUS RECEPTOR-LIKE PROTEIN KINASE-like 2.5 isoform X2 n=1 Tax=Salvia hispanica TaxID=49212 RepID=UPI002009A217|nr:LEAF RUST 10 DISEASE-RESISTANCE LOCUS RECEPTOR-LIKE PROTEIN KINASE-like 2.5 isoform X2 [Salvia hispanica]